MPATMKAAVVRAFGQPLAIEDVAIPRPGPFDLLVKVEASGVCHTDLHAANGDWPVKPRPPFIPGHEGVGVVQEVGSQVENISPGDRVGVPWLHSACGVCEHCWGGWETLCSKQTNTGYSVNGAFAEYLLADSRYVGRIPAGLSAAEAAPVLCAGVTVYKGLKMLDAQPGQWVAISGVGGLGHMAVQYARAMGLRVAAIDVDEPKLALARSLGAEFTLNAAGGDPVASIRKELGGVHGVVVTAVSPSAFEQSVQMLRPGGTAVLTGLPPGTFPVSIFNIVLNAITVKGSIVGTRLDLAEALDFAARGEVKATVSTRHLDKINQVFDEMVHGQIEGRVVLDFENV